MVLVGVPASLERLAARGVAAMLQLTLKAGAEMVGQVSVFVIFCLPQVGRDWLDNNLAGAGAARAAVWSEVVGQCGGVVGEVAVLGGDLSNQPALLSLLLHTTLHSLELVSEVGEDCWGALPCVDSSILVQVGTRLLSHWH